MGLFISGDINNYIEEHTTPQDDLLAELDRETHLHYILPQMLSGTVQGKFLEMMALMIRPKNILEIGTYTGYSAICLAKGLQPGGKLTTIDVDEELEDTVRAYIKRSGNAGVIDFKLGSAMDIVPGLDEEFDLVFIDADKINYGNYFDLVMPKLKVGGFIIADNVLWGGKVIDDEMDKETQAIVDFNRQVQNDPRVENVLLSVRDGIMIVRKLEN